MAYVPSNDKDGSRPKERSVVSCSFQVACLSHTN